jgi:hypothetical protein
LLCSGFGVGGDGEAEEVVGVVVETAVVDEGVSVDEGEVEGGLDDIFDVVATRIWLSSEMVRCGLQLDRYT